MVGDRQIPTKVGAQVDVTHIHMRAGPHARVRVKGTLIDVWEGARPSAAVVWREVH